MVMLRGMIAMSLDGYAADAAGGVGWLDPFHDVEWGYASFLEEIGPVVMGRATYDQLPSFGPGWHYPGHEGIVVTSTAIQGFAEARRWEGTLEALAEHLRTGEKDAWIMGGPRLQAAFLERGLLDRLELCVVPVLLGRGKRLFPEAGVSTRQPVLQGTRTLGKGMVMLDYRFTPAA